MYSSHRICVDCQHYECLPVVYKGLAHAAFAEYRFGWTTLRRVSLMYFHVNCQPGCIPLFANNKITVLVPFDLYKRDDVRILHCGSHNTVSVPQSVEDEIKEITWTLFQGEKSCVHEWVGSWGCRKVCVIGCCGVGGVCVYFKKNFYWTV